MVNHSVKDFPIIYLLAGEAVSVGVIGGAGSEGKHAMSRCLRPEDDGEDIDLAPKYD